MCICFLSAPLKSKVRTNSASTPRKKSLGSPSSSPMVALLSSGHHRRKRAAARGSGSGPSSPMDCNKAVQFTAHAPLRRCVWGASACDARLHEVAGANTVP